MLGDTYRSDPSLGGRCGCDESQVIGGDPAGLFFLKSAERHRCCCCRAFFTDWTLKGNWCKGSSTSSIPWVAGCVTTGRKRLRSSDKSMAIAHLGPALAHRPPRTPGLECTPQVIPSLPQSPLQDISAGSTSSVTGTPRLHRKPFYLQTALPV